MVGREQHRIGMAVQSVPFGVALQLLADASQETQRVRAYTTPSIRYFLEKPTDANWNSMKTEVAGTMIELGELMTIIKENAPWLSEFRSRRDIPGPAGRPVVFGLARASSRSSVRSRTLPPAYR
jgi:hypothetical protein